MKRKSIILLAILMFFMLKVPTNANYAFAGTTGIESQTITQQKPSQVVTIYLIRHGQTILNNHHRAQGWVDAPLTPSGEELIKQVGGRLAKVPFAAAYSSDSGRAVHTAQLILPANQATEKNVPLIQKKNLREVYFGSFEGEKMEVLWKKTANHLGMKNVDDFLTGKINRYEQLVNSLSELDNTAAAENYQRLSQRSFNEIENIAQDTRQRGGGNVLIVSHGITISAILKQIDAERVSKRIIENGGVTKLQYDGKNWRIIEGDKRDRL